MRKPLQLTFELLIEIGMIPIGALLVAGGWFILNVWIPTDTTGIWQSMDGWQTISFSQTMIEAVIVGSSLLIIGSILLIRSYIITRDPHRDTKLLMQPPTSLRAFAFCQSLAAIFVLHTMFRTWSNINVLGGPSGFMHLVPLTFPLFAAIIEVPVIALALLTWFDPRQEYLYGWLLIAILRITFSLSGLFLPWVIGLSPYSAPLGPHSAQTAEFLFGLTSIIIIHGLKRTFNEQEPLFHKARVP